MRSKGQHFLYFLFGVLAILLVFSVYKSYKYLQEKPGNQRQPDAQFSSDTLTIIGSGEKLHLYPENIQYDSDVFVMNQIYQGLVKLNMEMVEVPDLAKFWELDSSRTYYRFYLWDDVRFHDGKPVMADDVIRSIERFLQSKDSDYLRNFFRIIEGAPDFIAGKSRRLPGLIKLSDKAVAIRLSHPSASFLKLLALPEVKILPADYFAANKSRRNALPVGSGPYRVRQRTDSTLLLEAFRRKPEAPDGAWIKYVKILRLSPRILKRYKAKQFDLSYYFIESYVDSLEDFSRIQLSGLNLSFLGINSRSALGKDVSLRRALYFAFHQDTLLQHYDILGKPVKNISPLYLPNQSKTWIKLMPLYRTAKRTFLQKRKRRGATRRITAKITVDTLNYSSAVPQLLRQGFARLDIPVQLVSYNTSSWNQELHVLKNSDVFYVSWTLDLPDPEFFFEPFFRSDSKLNLMNYRSKKVDSLLAVAAREKNLNNRLNIYEQIEMILMQDLPVIPLYASTENLIFRNNLHGIHLNRMGLPSLYLADIWKEHNPK